jgi:putative peptidoglycan lipid II flippase
MITSVKNRLLNSFFGQSVFLNLLFVLEGIASFAVDLAIAAALGLAAQSDGLYAAWVIPRAIGRGMFQSLTNSLMGLFADEENPHRSYNQATSVVFVAALALAFLLSLLSVFWLPLTISGASPDTVAVAMPLAAFFSWLVVFLALSETFRAIFYREKNEYVPSLARLMGAVATIIIVLLREPSENLYWVALGIMIGALIEALIGFIALHWRLNFKVRFSWPQSDRLREIGGLIGPPIVGQGVRIIAGVVQLSLASWLAPGSLTAVSYANRIINTLERFVFRGFVISTIQSYSIKIREDQTARFRLIMLISLPLTVIFAVLSEPLIATLFGHGRFSAENVAVLATVLQSYALAIIGIALTRIPYGLAYAKKQGRMILGYFLTISIVLILASATFLRIDMDLQAFGLAYAIAMFAAFLWLYAALIRPFGVKIVNKKDVLRLSGVGISSAAITAIVVSMLPIWPEWLTLGIGVTVCFLATITAAAVFRLPEIDQIIQLSRNEQP